MLNDKRDPAFLNHTLIALIPKTKSPEDFSFFRPIGLCNVTMKIVTKAIANRVKLILPNLISEIQSAFVPQRLITDNAIIAFEIFHFLKKKKKGKKGYFALKLDMKKAYDRMEWNFIREVLSNMHFPENLTDLIMRCISSVTYSILINEKASSVVTPQRGLRQWDPLSPYIFIMCAEVFSSMLERAEEIQLIEGIKIARKAPPITHIFFADDSIIFSRADMKTMDAVMMIIKAYGGASGQQVNLAKTELSFSKNVS